LSGMADAPLRHAHYIDYENLHGGQYFGVTERVVTHTVIQMLMRYVQLRDM
jgi:hypothetical protein